MRNVRLTLSYDGTAYAGWQMQAGASTIQGALDRAPELPEWHDPAWMSKNGWSGWRDTLSSVHAPQGEEDLLPETAARQRLAYDELLADQLRADHLAFLHDQAAIRRRRYGSQ